MFVFKSTERPDNFKASDISPPKNKSNKSTTHLPTPPPSLSSKIDKLEDTLYKSSNSSCPTTSINISIDKYADIEESILHHLPCTIIHNGYAKVSNYFIVKNKDVNGKSIFESRLRGIKLYGDTIKVPQNFKGYIFRTEQDTPNKWETLSTFNSFTYWNRESIPSDLDKQQQVIKSLNIFSKIHQDISQDQVNKELEEMNSSSNSDSTITTTTTTTKSPNKNNLIESKYEKKEEEEEEEEDEVEVRRSKKLKLN
eukprot:gene7656-9419_t